MNMEWATQVPKVPKIDASLFQRRFRACEGFSTIQQVHQGLWPWLVPRGFRTKRGCTYVPHLIHNPHNPWPTRRKQCKVSELIAISLNKRLWDVCFPHSRISGRQGSSALKWKVGRWPLHVGRCQAIPSRVYTVYTFWRDSSQMLWISFKMNRFRKFSGESWKIGVDLISACKCRTTASPSITDGFVSSFMFAFGTMLAPSSSIQILLFRRFRRLCAYAPQGFRRISF